MSRKPPESEQPELFEKLPVSDLAVQQSAGSNQSFGFDQAQASSTYLYEDETPDTIPADNPPPRPVQVPNSCPRSPPERYVSVRDLCERFRVSKATIWRWTKYSPDFPGPLKLSNGTSRWRESEICAFEEGLRR